jgi:hypothetical protein
VAVGVIADERSAGAAVGFLGFVCAGALAVSFILSLRAFAASVFMENSDSESSDIRNPIHSAGHNVHPGHQSKKHNCLVVA